MKVILRIGSLLKLKLFPFTTNSIFCHHFNKKGFVVLDAGCGTSNVMEFIRLCGYDGISVGVDIFPPYLKLSKKKGSIQNDHVISDVRYLPFRDRSFDNVINIAVIEHLKKAEGLLLISTLERLSKHQVMIYTVTDYGTQDPFDGNIYQEHKSAWYPVEFRKRGYRIYGTLGLRTYGKRGWFLKRINPLVTRFPTILRVLSQPFVYTKPEISFLMLCVKNKGD